MSRTFTEQPIKLSQPIAASRSSLRSPSQFGMSEIPGAWKPSRDLNNTIGGKGPSDGSGLYSPSTVEFNRNCALTNRRMPVRDLCVSRFMTLSRRDSGNGTWLTGLGESMRMTRASAPCLRSCRATSKATTPPNDQPDGTRNGSVHKHELLLDRALTSDQDRIRSDFQHIICVFSRHRYKTVPRPRDIIHEVGIMNAPDITVQR